MLALGAPARAADDPTYLGVLEAGQDSGFSVRLAFRFENGRWEAMPHDAGDPEALAKLAALYPAKASWTIALDGKNIGSVASVRPRTYERYRDVGLEALTPDSKAPAIRSGAQAFETWDGTPRYRPLAAVSRPNFSDPDHWKPFRPSASLGQQAHAAFRKAIALDPGCDNRPTRDYPEAYIQLLEKAYRSSRGDVLLALRADPSKNRCDVQDAEWRSVWFLVRDNAVTWIGNGLALIDAGDYDGDGISELLFQSSGYNLDGYVLFNVRDATAQRFEWSYH